MQTKPRIELDPSQRAAAERAASTSTNVVAGAGTGKTSVLVARYMQLAERDGIPLDRLLALTFTLKAAAEMRDRIRSEVLRRLPGQGRLLGGAWIMNFHQFGYRFIKENAPALAVDPGVDVVSPAEYQRVMNRMQSRFEAGRIAGIPPEFGGEPPAPTELPALFDTLMKVVHKCRGNMIDPVQLRALCAPEENPAYLARVDAVVALACAWEEELRRRNLLDFSDMISIPARTLMTNTAVAARYRGAFDHILVDEFQDTSRAQNEMLRALSGDDFSRVTVVGDVKQAIYRWRDARTENITEFPAERKELLINYRSRQNILDLAQQLVEPAAELNGFAPALKADRGAGRHPVLMFHPEGEEASYEIEAAAVADWVEYLLERSAAPPAWELPRPDAKLDPDDVVILLRNFRNSRSRSAIEGEFARRAIPYAIIGGAASGEAIALEAWHELLALLLPGPGATHLLAVLESNPFAISEASLHDLLFKASRASAQELLAEERIALISDARDAETVRALREQLAVLSDALQRLGFREFVAWAIERTPLRLELARAGVSGDATDDLLREVFDLADTLSRHEGVSLASFLDHLDATLDEGKFREDGDVRLPDGRVAIMTVHQAKGLEFPAVAVVGVSPQRRNSDEHFTVSAEHGIFFSKSMAGAWNRDREKAPEYDYDKRQEEIEERCILYVALTRARDHLWVSSPFGEGISRTRGERASLFTELLASAREKALARELRVTGPAREFAMPTKTETLADVEVEALLRDWTTRRGAAERREMGARATAPSMATITWASLARYEICPFAFWLDRSAPHTVPDDASREEVSHEPSALELPKGVDPAEFGAFVHAVLERRDDIGALERTITRIAARYNFGRHAAAMMDLARARIAGACAAGLAGASDGAQSELPFSVRVNNVLLHGVIDRLDVLKNGALVTDYKLGAPHASHHFQVAVYAWAVQRVLGAETVRARLAYIGYDPTRVDEIEPEHARIGALMDAMGKSFEAEEFTAKPGEVCVTCGHRANCSFAAATETPAAQS